MQPPKGKIHVEAKAQPSRDPRQLTIRKGKKRKRVFNRQVLEFCLIKISIATESTGYSDASRTIPLEVGGWRLEVARSKRKVAGDEQQQQRAGDDDALGCAHYQLQ